MGGRSRCDRDTCDDARGVGEVDGDGGEGFAMERFQAYTPHCKQTRERRVEEKGKGEGATRAGAGRRRPIDGGLGD